MPEHEIQWINWQRPLTNIVQGISSLFKNRLTLVAVRRISFPKLGSANSPEPPASPTLARLASICTLRHQKERSSYVARNGKFLPALGRTKNSFPSGRETA